MKKLIISVVPAFLMFSCFGNPVKNPAVKSYRIMFNGIVSHFGQDIDTTKIIGYGIISEEELNNKVRESMHLLMPENSTKEFSEFILDIFLYNEYKEFYKYIDEQYGRKVFLAKKFGVYRIISKNYLEDFRQICEYNNKTLVTCKTEFEGKYYCIYALFNKDSIFLENDL